MKKLGEMCPLQAVLRQYRSHGTLGQFAVLAWVQFVADSQRSVLSNTTLVGAVVVYSAPPRWAYCDPQQHTAHGVVFSAICQDEDADNVVASNDPDPFAAVDADVAASNRPGG